VKVCVFGSGGVGAYFGACLARAGVDVTFIARGAHLAVMQSSGLKVSGISGEFHLPTVCAVETPMENAPYELVIVAVKAWQVEEAALTLKDTLSDNAMVIPLQNGVEAPDQLAKILGEDRVLTGLCGIVSYLKESGHVYHAGIEPYIQIGERVGAGGDRIDRVLELLKKAEGVTVTAPDDIQVSYWLKFMFIVTMSGIGSITRAPIGVTREHLDTRALMQQCVTEVYTVGCAHGVSLPSDAVERIMKMIMAAPAAATASMQRDIIAGKPSELFFQNTAVTRLGTAVGVETPINQFISSALAAQESRARGQVEF